MSWSGQRPPGFLPSEPFDGVLLVNLLLSKRARGRELLSLSLTHGWGRISSPSMYTGTPGPVKSALYAKGEPAAGAVPLVCSHRFTFFYVVVVMFTSTLVNSIREAE